MYPFVVLLKNFPIDCYNIMGFIGIYLPILLAFLLWREYDIARPWQIAAASIIAVAIGSAGGSLTHILLHISNFTGKSLLAIILNKGRAVVGFYVFFVLGYYLMARFWKISFKSVMDHMIAFIALARVFGRMGCLFAGCCHGTISSVPWAVYFGDNLLRHPTQVYMIIIAVAIFISCRLFYNALKKYPGLIFFSAVSMYGAGRFFVEFLRVDSPYILGVFKLSHFAMVLLLLYGLVGMRKIISKYPNEIDLKKTLLRMYCIYVITIILACVVCLGALIFIPKRNRVVAARIYVGNIVPTKNLKESTLEHNRIVILQKALVKYKLDNGEYPTTEQGLAALILMPDIEPIPENWSGPYVERKYIFKKNTSYRYERFKVENRYFYWLG